MFDMDLFGGKKVPRTKYQESGAPSGLHGGPFPKIMFYVMIKVMRAAAHGSISENHTHAKPMSSKGGMIVSILCLLALSKI